VAVDYHGAAASAMGMHKASMRVGVCITLCLQQDAIFLIAVEDGCHPSIMQCKCK
jgi:hypothetical protein